MNIYPPLSIHGSKIRSDQAFDDSDHDPYSVQTTPSLIIYLNTPLSRLDRPEFGHIARPALHPAEIGRTKGFGKTCFSGSTSEPARNEHNKILTSSVRDIYPPFELCHPLPVLPFDTRFLCTKHRTFDHSPNISSRLTLTPDSPDQSPRWFNKTSSSQSS